MEILQQLDNELLRIAIAGTNLAKGDFKLNEILDTCEILAAKSPVFAKLAKLLATLTTQDAGENTETFLELRNLTRAILRSQASSKIKGEFKLIKSHNIDMGRGATYRQLVRIIDALTQSGSGRLDVLVEAEKEGLLRDYRLLGYLINGLNDRYTPVAEICYSAVVKFGTTVNIANIPCDKKKDTEAELRKIRLFFEIWGSKAMSTFGDVLDKGLFNQQKQIIYCCSADVDGQKILLEHIYGTANEGKIEYALRTVIERGVLDPAWYKRIGHALCDPIEFKYIKDLFDKLPFDKVKPHIYNMDKFLELARQ